MRPEAGQGARNAKSYMLAGGAIDTKPVISGRRIKSCMPIQAPKEMPQTQTLEGLGYSVFIQSSTAAASDNSPEPLSKLPWLRPTPRKLNRTVVQPSPWNM